MEKRGWHLRIRDLAVEHVESRVPFHPSDPHPAAVQEPGKQEPRLPSLQAETLKALEAWLCGQPKRLLDALGPGL